MLFEQLRQASKRVVLTCEIATADSFAKLKEGKRDVILHFSGHGTEDELEIEDGFGGTNMVDSHSIMEAIGGGDKSVESVKLAVVSACHSETIGRCLIKAGVPHVIAVRRSQAVLDAAAKSFLGAFYSKLVRGNTIRSAFQSARASTHAAGTGSTLHARDVPFLLLPDEAEHDEAPFSESEIGK